MLANDTTIKRSGEEAMFILRNRGNANDVRATKRVRNTTLTK